MSVTSSLNNLPILTPDLRKLFEEFGYIKMYKKDDVVLNEAATIKTIPIVLNGNLKVLRQEQDSREILLYYLTPGESCIMSVFGSLYGQKSKIRAVAETDCELLMLPSEKLGTWLIKYPDWINFILSLYHKRFEDMLTIINEMAFSNMEERILNWLRKKSELLKTKEIVVTHQQIADELGTTREVVSRILKNLESSGGLILNRNKISLK